MKKTFFFLTLTMFGALLLTGCIFNQNTNQPVVGGDRDAHGCIGSAGYSWCEASQKCLRIWEEGCADQIYTFFNQLKEKTKINFGEVLNNTELTWMVKNGETDLEYKLPAYEMEASSVDQAKLSNVYNFFIMAGFEKDENNQTIKSIAGHSIGYSHSGFSIVCGIGDLDNKVAIYCANWNENLIAGDLAKKEIASLLAQKYNKKIADVNLTINKEVENYISGGVKFGADQTAEGGMFLATKINGIWQLVYDGNGSVNCQELRDKYNFPDEILKPNFCD